MADGRPPAPDPPPVMLPVVPPVPPVQLPVPPAQPIVQSAQPIQPGPVPQLNRLHFRPELAGKPDEDVKSTSS